MNGNVKPLFNKSSNKAHLAVVPAEKKLSDLTDEELILACQENRKGAIDLLLKRYQSTLTAMVRKRFPELSDISDVLQEAQIRMWRSIGQLRSPAAFKSWLGQIVTNLCYDELRRKVKNQDVISLDASYESEDGDKMDKMERLVADTRHQPDKDLQRKELIQALESALESIPQEFRQPVLLREVDGLSYDEIAAVMNTELGTVKSRISRARTKIQKRMEGYLKEAA